MTPPEALAFVRAKGVVLESARGPLPTLTELIAGERIRGSWWGHPKSRQIFRCSRALRASKDILVCRLVEGKVTYVHRRLWPALVTLQDCFDSKRLGAIREVHTAQGKHESNTTPFPKWVPQDVETEAASLTRAQAAKLFPLKLRTEGKH